MKEKILYVYGYGSNPNDSFTMKELKKVTDELGYELVSTEYSQEYPEGWGLPKLDKYITDNNIKYVIGHSLGGFITLCLMSNVKKLVINPCLKPHLIIPQIGKVSTETIYNYEHLEGWLSSGDSTPWVDQTEDVMGLFGDHDEMFSFYGDFKKRYPRAYYINADHRPKAESYTEDIKKKIKEFFS